MHHRKAGRALGRTSSHRTAMYRNMTKSLIAHGTIKTTLAKAKEFRRFVEPVITRSGNDSLANRRLIFSRIRDKQCIHILFTIVGPHYKQRPGGYIRIIKSGYRAGDNAPMAIVQLVDFDSGKLKPLKNEQSIKENLVEKTPVAPKKSELSEDKKAPVSTEKAILDQNSKNHDNVKEEFKSSESEPKKN